MGFIKTWFGSYENKTGCRFIVVDAYNQEKVIQYYQRNGFLILEAKGSGKDDKNTTSSLLKTSANSISENEPLAEEPATKAMFFDLLQVIPE